MRESAQTPEEPFSELTTLARPAEARPVVQGSWPGRLFDRVLSYVPVFFMAFLAGFSWWLVKNSPGSGADAIAVDAPQAPDYAMEGFVLSTYGVDGTLRSLLEGDSMQHFAATDTVDIQTVRLRSIDPAGRLLLGSSRRAHSNGDATRVQLMGDARIVREPGEGETAADRLELRGEFLEVLTESERIRSHLPVSLLSTRAEVHGGTLDYSRQERVAQFGGRVTGQLRAVKESP